MTDSSNATPRPWEYALNVGPTRALIYRNGESIADVLNLGTDGEKFAAVMALIVQAVNERDALLAEVATLRAVVEKAEYYIRLRQASGYDTLNRAQCRELQSLFKSALSTAPDKAKTGRE